MTTETVVPLNRDGSGVSGDLIVNALSAAIIAVDGGLRILRVNTAAEQLLRHSSTYLQGRRLDDIFPADSPIFELIEQVQTEMQAVSEYGITVDTPRIGRHFINIHAVPLVERPEHIVLSLNSRSIAEKIDRQLSHRGAARSVSAMAALLAHEVKNPLSGIRGAAQLLDDNVTTEDRTLTRLIRDEVDRICSLVDRMGMFEDNAPINRAPVNIHQVLDHVYQIAKNGFGRRTRFVTNFDPSLPPVLGDRDQLVQVFLNLIKNAVEAAPQEDGEVVMETAYQHGVRFAAPGTQERVHLPLAITITDNGVGISDDIRPYLFEPFISSKPKGSGLGLPLVAKIVGDHGGVIECESQPNRTVFRVMLPMSEGEGNTP